MPLDPSIPLQVKPVRVETPDFNANTRVKEEEAAHAQERCQALEADHAQLKGLS
jgi:hypothetical protein